MLFTLFIGFIIALRIVELIIARSNEKWMRAQGAIEYGQAHYPFIVALHSLFFVSLIVEYSLSDKQHLYPILILVYMIVVTIKFWVIGSLCKYWNTKILRIPNAVLVKKGLYKYIKHPNYVLVVAELLLIPLCFQLYVTAIVFGLLNALMLRIRIKEENRVLGYSS